MAGLDGDTGAHLDSGQGQQNGIFQRKKVIAQVFAGVGDYGQSGARVKQLYIQHNELMVIEQGLNGGNWAGDR
jgi:hypothetical protein